jgi:type II restriction enzyme
MENLVHGYLKSFCQNHKDFRLIEQATSEKLERYFGLNISLDKRFSFALFNAQTKQIFLIEANYYSRSGSKMKATAGEYKDLNDLLKKQNAIFIWITDGQGWLTALRPLEETFNHNDYVINLSMLQNGILSKILNVA